MAMTTMTTPAKNTRPVRRGKKNTMIAQPKGDGAKSDDRGGIQTNKVDAVADDEWTTEKNPI